MELTGYRTYSETGKTVYDKDTYELIKKHSRWFDRINPKKMITMWEVASAIMEDAILEPKEPNWMFFGRRAPKGI